MKHGDNFECILCGVEVKGKIITYNNGKVTYVFLAQNNISIRTSFIDRTFNNQVDLQGFKYAYVLSYMQYCHLNNGFNTQSIKNFILTENNRKSRIENLNI